MADYKFVLYETLDSGRIARIMLNRPDSRNAQNRGLLVELQRRLLAGRGGRRGPRRHPGRDGSDVLLRARPRFEGGA